MTAVKGIGRKIQIGIAKESSRGTANTTTGLYWLSYADASIEERYNNAIDEEVYGVIEDSISETRTKSWAEGPLKAPIGTSSFGLVLLALLGTDTVSTHSGESAVYDHVFTVAQTATHQSLTVLIHDPLSGVDYSHANSVLHTLKLEYVQDKFIAYTVDMKGLAGVKPNGGAVSFSPTQTTAETRFVPQYFSFKTASALTGLNAATAIGIRSLNLTINENIEEDSVMGSVAPRDFLNKTFSVEGDLEAIWNGEADFKTNAIANTPQALRLDLVNTDVTIGNSTNPRFVIDMAKCVFTEFSRPVKIKDLMYQNVKFKAHYSLGDGQMIKATLTNTVATY